MASDLPVVYRAADIGEADIVAAWLEEQGIKAFVEDENAAAVLSATMIVAPRGLPVCVGPEDFDAAKIMLEEHREEIRLRHLAQAGSLVAARCEECGNVTKFPAAQNGTVQTCPNCKANMDVEAIAT